VSHCNQLKVSHFIQNQIPGVYLPGTENLLTVASCCQLAVMWNSQHFCLLISGKDGAFFQQGMMLTKANMIFANKFEMLRWQTLSRDRNILLFYNLR